MNVFAAFLSLFFPLCGTHGANGIAAPGVVDFTHPPLQGHSEYLIGPPGFFSPAAETTPIFNIDPAALFNAVKVAAAAQPRTFELDTKPQALQAAYVVRTPSANFPDVIEIAVISEPGGKSGLIFYSHSIYGASDYGVNRKHTAAWLQTLNAKVTP